MLGLKELEAAIGQAVVDLNDEELWALIKVLEGRLAARMRDRERAFEELIHPSWRGVKVRSMNAILLLKPRLRASVGRKKAVQISDADLLKAVELFKAMGLGKLDVDVLREVLIWKSGPGKRTVGKEFDTKVSRLQSRLSEARKKVLKLESGD